MGQWDRNVAAWTFKPPRKRIPSLPLPKEEQDRRPTLKHAARHHFWFINAVFVYYSVMKFPKVLLVIPVLVLSALSVVAQTTAGSPQQKAISKKDFEKVDKKARESLKTATYRVTQTFEYFEEPDKIGAVMDRSVTENIHPNKWRHVDESNYPRPSKYEYISDGKYFFKRKNDGDWIKSIGGSTEGRESRETDDLTNVRYRFLGKANLHGTKADKYEVESLRVANPFSMTDMLTYSGSRCATYWYDESGRILRKVEVNGIDGSKGTWVETFEYVYDPKDLKIEAPIK